MHFLNKTSCTLKFHFANGFLRYEKNFMLNNLYKDVMRFVVFCKEEASFAECETWTWSWKTRSQQ